MPLMKNFLLWCSVNPRLKVRVPKMRFTQRAVKRFMPGETIDSALAEVRTLEQFGITTVLTYLGENLSDLREADAARDHYLQILEKIIQGNHPSEISFKLTQLGFDLSCEKTLAHVRTIVRRGKELGIFVWIDIESHAYVDKTLDLYRTVRSEFENVGLCLQSYLYRTKDDLNGLMSIVPSIRLVKGAYKEPASVAFAHKRDVDQSFVDLADQMLFHYPDKVMRIGIATHDTTIIDHVKSFARERGIPKEAFEFQLLYGVKRDVQLQLAKEGYNVRVLISYGSSWYAWYLRRLAERPANVWFVVKSLFG